MINIFINLILVLYRMQTFDVIKILMGLFLGSLIAYFIDIRTNIMVKGPDSSKIQKTIFTDNNNICYKLTPYPVLSRGIHM